VRDQPIAVVDWHAHALPFALTLTQWTRQITVVTDGRSPELTVAERDALAAHGIPILTQTVRHFEGTDGQLTGLRFMDGSRLPVCSALFNIRHEVNSELPAQLGCALTDDDYVVVDEHLRTSVEHVWAAGDMCEYDSVFHGQPVRIEHWDVAFNQGKTVALNMLGRGQPHDVVPYFFSDLADWASLEYVGPALRWDREVVRGSLDDGEFAIFYLDGGRVAGCLAVESSDALNEASRLLRDRVDVSGQEARLADSESDLAELT
jgi:3-phenylpropionate/trans-cinnamate dioxygenase ferredoxin reductase subunit